MEISSVIVQIFERTKLEPDVRIGKKAAGGERKGGLKLSRRISSFLHEQPAFDEPSISFSPLRISDLSTVSRDFCLVRRSPAPSLHRKLANNSRKRRELERKGERTLVGEIPIPFLSLERFSGIPSIRGIP